MRAWDLHPTNMRKHTNTESASREATHGQFNGRPGAIKLGISNLCADLCDDPDDAPDHELFVQGGSAYYYTDQKLFLIGSHPVVRVRPAVPLRYTTRGWDFGWLMVRSDGHVVYRRCDPYTLKFSPPA